MVKADYKKIARDVNKWQNSVRTNPKSFVGVLEGMLKHFKGTNYSVPGKTTMMTIEGAKAVKACIERLKKQ